MFISVFQSYTGLLRVAGAAIVLQRALCNCYISLKSGLLYPCPSNLASQNMNCKE